MGVIRNEGAVEVGLRHSAFRQQRTPKKERVDRGCRNNEYLKGANFQPLHRLGKKTDFLNSHTD